MCYNTVLMSYMICLQAAKQKKISTKKNFPTPYSFFWTFVLGNKLFFLSGLKELIPEDVVGKTVYTFSNTHFQRPYLQR